MSSTTPCSPCTDCTTPAIGPVCPTPPSYTANTCPVVVETDCVQYSGPDNTCIGVTSSGTPMTLTQSIIAILNYLSTLWTRLTSSSLSVTTSGTCSNVVAVELVPSSQSGNILILGNDGRPYVPQTLVNMASSKCITWQSSGPVGNILWTPVIDFNCVSVNITSQAIACVAPTGVTLTGITINSASVSFTAIGGNTYDIMLNGIVIQTGATSPYAITGLLPATNYTVIVRADCPSGSTSETITTFTTLPIVTCNNPSNLQITSV